MHVLVSLAAVLALIAAACGDDDDDAAGSDTTTTTGGTTTEAPAELQSVELLLPGLPGAAAGGYFAAAEPEIASKYGLELEITAGGQGVFNTIPQVASGQAKFSLSSTANLYSARAEDIPVVQIFAGYDYPVCFMSHEGAGIDDFSDLQGQTVAVTPGSSYWEYIKARFELDNVNEVAYTGGIGPFAADSSLIQQCITLNEPFVAEQEGIAHELLLVSDSGFNPYQNALFTTDEVIENEPDLVEMVVGAVHEGWETYLADPGPTNERLLDLGSTQTIEHMEFVAAEIRDNLISGELGFTDPERAETLYNQLREVGVLGTELDWEAVFSNEFLP